MRRWLPLLFLGCSLLAQGIEWVRYDRFLAEWTPVARYSTPQPFGLFMFVSLPLSLAIIWKFWKPRVQQENEVGLNSRHAGKALLVFSVLAWLYFLVRSGVDAWMAATPAPDPLGWLKRAAMWSIISTASLALGGLAALWLMGARMPKDPARH